MIQQDASDMEVILNILAAGPDYVEKRMTDVRLSRGSGSPAVVRLIDLLSTATEASSADGGKPVRDQHVVSQVLSGQFCEVVNPKDGLQLRRWNLAYMTNDLKSPAAVGKDDLFVKIDTRKVEELWNQRVETHLRQATEATAAGQLTAASDDVIRDAIALHLVRNPATSEIHENVFERVYASNVEKYARTYLSVEAFRRRYGIVPAGEDGLEMGARLLLDDIRQKVESGAMFRFRVQDQYERWSAQFRDFDLDVIAVANGIAAEFLLGDSPVLAIDADADPIDICPLINATHVVLPLAPRLLAVLGPAGLRSIPIADLVDRINELEVGAARTAVFHHPSADFTTKIPAWCNGHHL
jgi:hypothetical protein